MFLEYDWMFDVYRPRLGRDGFTDIRGHRSFPSIVIAKNVLAQCGLKIGRKTGTRTWAIVSCTER